MPVYSMTGYASGQNTPGGSHAEADARPAVAGRLGVEIRSVNSRFLDLTFKLPEELRQHEPALRELLTRSLKRGKVEVRANFENSAASGVVEPSVKLLQRLNGVQDGIKAWLPSARELSVADVLRLASGDGSARGDWGADLVEVTGKTLAAMMEARAREGARLASMLNEHLGELRKLAAQAGPLVPKLVEQQRTRFLERWQEAMGLVGGTLPEAAQDRALTEATAFAIRIDVAEELTRLSSHLDEIERLVAKGGEIGKRLDFLIQELHREANTLGSKSAALELTRIGVDMKVLIEQMREQVQNIE
ncbi:YicC/YloC family endoribonuclease [Variovorax sp. J22G21]|uniref:YicC/YloC family endoribonuclease n=1 Tax=Variovorax fucosicus TaxID=3053517 RepID=UPI002577011C|nr:MULTISPECIES: YicC/YloC family endoribonuclease [unclassified Variovorax]MDM0039981.1 YicC/YloC family endoribonuclease [Variovorax sp. J22R193]MDM0061354.1 YicC/YloC family endoribonuclease [Variovorax sp. J22G21]